MSDVSGIPYMGPMGQGNFFAPQFPANPQINPTAGYAAPAAYAQNVTNNLYSSGGGFGQQTNYYSGLGASYSAAGMSPYGVFSEGGGGGGGASPYQTTPDVWNTGAAPFQGGGGSSGLGGSIYGGDLGGGYSGPSIDWGGVGKAAAGMNIDPYPGMSMPGGLNSSFSAPSGASPFNWSDLWGGSGGGGGYTSGIAPDTTGGRDFGGSAPSIDWNSFKSPSTNYGTFQGGGASDYTSGIAPDTTGGRDFDWPAADPAPGMAMPGGLGSPMTMPEASAKTQDQAPFDFSGPTSGWNNAPAPMPDTQQLLGYDPQKRPDETDWSTFQSPATNYDTFQAPAQEGGGGGTDKIVEEARSRLAGIIGSPETAKAVESPATDYGTFQKGATAPAGERPADRVDMSLEGKVDALRNTVRKELEAQGLYMTSDYRGPGHDLYRPGSKHSDALAFDTRARTPEQADAARAQIKELFEARGMREGRDFTFIDEVRNPIGGITKGPHLHTTLTPEGMQRYQQSAYDVNAPRPPADIPYPQGIPLPTERPAEAGPSAVHDPNRPPANIPEFPAARLAPNGQEPEAFVIHHTEGRPTLESVVNYWRSGSGGRGEGIGAQYFLDRNAVIHDVAAETGYTGTNQTKTGAFPGVKHLNNSNVVGIEISAKNDADVTPAQRAVLTQFAEERFSTTPFYGHAEVAHKDPDEGIGGANAILDARVAANPNMFPSAGFWDQLAEQNKSAGVPLPTPRSEGADVPRPPANVGPSGVEKSQTFLNRSLESILQQHAPDKIGQAGMFIDLKQPLREALNGPFGSQIRSNLEPKLGSVGLTRDDFAKAVADPRARFVEGGDFGPYPAYTGPEAAPGSSSYTSGIPPDTTGGRDFSGGGDVYSQFRQSENIEDRRGEQGPITDTPIDNTWWQDAPPLWSGDVVSETGMRDFPSPVNDYSAFQQPASRDDLAKTMTFSGGFSPSPEKREGGVGPPVELTPEHMRTMEEIESHQNPKLHDKGSSYKGLYQLDDTEFRKYGGTGSIFNAEQNTKAATAKMYAEGQRAQDILGRALTPVEQYMVHQQGLAGTLSHLANPDQPAWKSFQQASQWSDARAKTAIWGNLSNDQKAQFGNDVNSITSRDFINLWTTMYYQKMVASGLSPGGFSDRPQ